MDQTNQPTTLNDLAQGGQKKDLVMTPDIRAFLESILNDAHITSLDEQMHEEMLNQLYVRLDKFLISSIIDVMPDEKLEEFITMQEKGASKQEVEEYMQKYIPNAQQVFTDAFQQFRQLYLTNVTVARNAPGGPGALVEEQAKKES